MKAETIETAGAQPANPACTVERKALADALAFICRIVERRNTIPILSNVALGVADGGGLSLFATDLDVQAELSVPAVWTVPGSFTVDAAALRDVVKKASGDTVTLSMENERLTIASGRAVNKLATLPIDDYPVIAAPGADAVRFQLPADQFARDLGAIAPAMSKEETRYYLNGALFQIADVDGAPCLAIVATDGHQMARVARAVPDGAEALAPSIIPRKFVSVALAMLKKAGPYPLSMEIGEFKASVAGPGFRLTTKLIDGTFPDWQDAIAKATGDGGLQRVAMVELEPRLNAPMIAGLAKAAGATLSVETGETAALLSAADYPEWQGLTMLMREDKAPKGFGFNDYEHADRHAEAYLEELRDRRELPPLESAGLVRAKDGRTMGLQFGTGQWISGETVEVVDYETLTVREEVREGYYQWDEGAYSVPMPRAAQALVSVEIVADDGEAEFHHLRTNAAGAIGLSKEAVRELCGDQGERVEIAPLQFLHGAIVTGYYFPPAPSIAVGSGKRRRAMSDSDQMAEYCRNPGAFMEMIRARPADEPCRVERENMAAAAVEAFARAAMQQSQIATVATTDDNRLSDIAEPRAPRKPAEHRPEPAAVTGASVPAPISSASEAGNDAAIEPDPDLAALVAALLARVEALEAAQRPLSVESEPAPRSVERPGRSPARERLLRRYLAMRAEREDMALAARVAAGIAATREARRDKNASGLRQALEIERGNVADLRRQVKVLGEAQLDRERLARAKRRLARRGAEMRRRADLDRRALLAAGDYVRQADAERDAAKIAATPPPVHFDQAPGYGVIAQLHREREESANKLAAAASREASLHRMVERLSDEIGQLSGRAIRAEQALQVYRVPVLAIADMREARAMEREV